MGAEIEVVEPTLFEYLVHYSAPLTGGGNTMLPPGVRLIVTGLPRIQLLRGGKVMWLIGHSARIEFSNPGLEVMYIHPVVGILDHAKEEMRASYDGYSLYLDAEL